MSEKFSTVIDDSKNTFSFDVLLKNSTITQGQSFISSEYTVKNLSWKISVKKNSKAGLAVYLYASPPSTNSVLWSCFAFIRFTLVSLKSSLLGAKNFDYSREFKHLFTSDVSNQGFENFMDWNSVTSTEKGYISNDEIKFRVYIEADIPQNIISDHYVAKPLDTKNWFRLLEKKSFDRIVLRLSDEFKRIDATIAEVKSSMNDLRTDLKKIADPIVHSVRNEVTSLEKKLEKTNSSFSAAIDPISAVISREIQTLEEKLKKYYSERCLETQTAEKTLETFCTNHSSETQALGKKLEKLSSDLSMGMQVFEKKLDLSTEMQAFEKVLEKFFLELFTKIVDELKNMNFKKCETSDNGLPEKKIVTESEQNSNGKEMISKQVNVIKDKAVPVSVLKIMKEIIVEQHQRFYLNHVPNLPMYCTNDHEESMINSYYQHLMREPESHFHGLCNDNRSDSFINFSHLQTRNMATDKGLEMKRGNFYNSCSTVQQHIHKNEKRKSEEVVESNRDDMSGCSNRMKMLKPAVAPEKLTDPSQEEFLFLGKNEDGEMKMHKVSRPQQLIDLKKEYKKYKIWKADEF